MKWQKRRLFKKKWYVGRKGLSWVTETTGFDGGTDGGTDCQEWRWLSPMLKRDGGSTEEDRSKVTDLDCDEMRHYIRQDRRWEGAPLSFHARSDQSALLWDSSYHKESYSFSRSQGKKKKYGNKSIIPSAPALQHNRRAAGWNFAKCRSLVTHHQTHYLSYC